MEDDFVFCFLFFSLEVQMRWDEDVKIRLRIEWTM